MHALIADVLPPEARAGLEALGLEVSEDASLGSHNLPDAVGSVDVLVVGATRITRRTIEAADQLKLIVRAGSGVDTIDVAAASERGVFVAHCAAADAAARAELVFASVLALDRGLPAGTSAPALGLRGRSLGLWGWDATALQVKRVADGFGMRVRVYDPAMTTALASEAEVHLAESAEALLSRCDIVSLHPATDERGPLATAERVAALPAGATLINVTRRGLIDLDAAKARLEEGTLRLALDVYDADDYGDDVPFAADAFPTLRVTHRAGANTVEAMDGIASAVVGNVEAWLLTDRVCECVNVAAAEADDKSVLLISHRPDGGVLASIFEALRDAEVAVHDVATGHFTGGAAAFVRVVVDQAPSPGLVRALQRHPAAIRLDGR